jgi:hypothetical protein
MFRLMQVSHPQDCMLGQSYLINNQTRVVLDYIIYLTSCKYTTEMARHKTFTTQFRLALKVRMSGAIPLCPYTPSRRDSDNL